MVILLLFTFIILISFIIINGISNPTPTSDNVPQKKRLYDPANLPDEYAEAKRQAIDFGDEETRFAIVHGIYTGPLPELLPNGTWSALYDKYLKYSIAGINFRRLPKSFVGKVTCILTPDPKNKHDKNAIKILSADGHHLGFIPADSTAVVSDFLAGHFPHRCRGIIHERTDNYDGHSYLYGEIYIQKEEI